MLDRIIFGDNQFFGINHMSEEKARDLGEKFMAVIDQPDSPDPCCNVGSRKGIQVIGNKKCRFACQ